MSTDPADRGAETSMNSVVFERVSFMYPEGERVVFHDMSLTLPQGVVSLVGQNGVGKSTLMLLAGGRLLPTEGTVKLLGRSTETIADEAERNAMASFIYQNMEFESEETIGDLLEFVYENGSHEKKDPEFLSSLIKRFELGNCRGRRIQSVSKGEIQRTIIVFSLLYGSPVIFMDEPIFALEAYQKEYAMKFLTEYAREYGVSIYYSVHEIDISKRYSDRVMLFGKDGSIRIGPPETVLSRENIEAAYQIPYALLHKKEDLYRDLLLTRPPVEDSM